MGRHRGNAMGLEKHREPPGQSLSAELAAKHRIRAKQHAYVEEYAEARKHFRFATTLDPTFKEGFIDLAEFEYKRRAWKRCYDACLFAMEITVNHATYITDWDKCESSLVFDLAALSCWHLNLMVEGKAFAVEALRRSPTDERLKENLGLFP